MPPFVFVRAGVLLTNDEEDLYKILVFWNAKNPSPLGHVRVCVREKDFASLSLEGLKPASVSWLHLQTGLNWFSGKCFVCPMESWEGSCGALVMSHTR